MILSSELPLPAFTEQAIEASVRRSRLTIAAVSPAYLRDRWAGFAELLSRNVTDDGRGGRRSAPMTDADGLDQACTGGVHPRIYQRAEGGA